MSALQSIEARFEPMTVEWLESVLAIEQSAYSNPWTFANFTDSLHAGYHSQLLVAGDTLLGYFVAMKGVDEVHLLNITVAPACQRQGWALVMLEALDLWSRAQKALWLWLEVRVSNQRAIDIYTRHGYRRVSVRKGYYPAVVSGGAREDAVIMSLRLDGFGSATP